MVDLSKHLTRMKKSIQTRNYPLAIEIGLECQEIDPTNVELYKLVIDASKRRAQEGGKKGFGFSLGLGSKDPQKNLTAMVKKATKAPDLKSFMACGDAAMDVFDSGIKPMVYVAICFYEEAKATGLFDEQLLWNMGQAYHEAYKISKDAEHVDLAIKTMAELNKAAPTHKEAGRTLKAWEAERSIQRRNDKAATGSDYRAQLASDEGAQRAEIMGRAIRSKEDAEAVLKFVEEDIQKNPQDKQLWMKRGDVYKRIGSFDKARESFEKAIEIDPHDFTLVVSRGDCEMNERKQKIKVAEEAGQDTTAAKKELMEFEIGVYKERIERQPTELAHRYNLGIRLFRLGEIDQAAGEFQRSVNDPRHMKQSHKYLGHCFVKRKLYDLAIEQFSQFLDKTDDAHDPEAKEVLYNRARLREQTKKSEDAIKDFRKLVEMDLGYKDAAERLGKLQEAS